MPPAPHTYQYPKVTPVAGGASKPPTGSEGRKPSGSAQRP